MAICKSGNGEMRVWRWRNASLDMAKCESGNGEMLTGDGEVLSVVLLRVLFCCC